MEQEGTEDLYRRTLRIFISSPSDVNKERDKAKQVISQLQKWYGSAVLLNPVLWEELPLEMNQGFQPGIDVILSKDKGIDIAVFILWSRIGTPVKIGDKTYQSGTEREFDLMLKALEKSGGERPKVLFYKRSDDDSFAGIISSPENQDQLEELVRQRNLAKAFFEDNFWEKDGHNARAFHSYSQPVEFAGRLKIHLRNLIDGKLEESGFYRKAQWTDAPYRGLETFDVEHADIFFGREREVVELENRLRQREQAEDGCAFVAVIGASGSGKSSFVRAGLRSSLTRFNFDESVSEWRTMLMTPGQADVDPVLFLFNCLSEPEALPELKAIRVSQDEILQGLKESPGTTINLIIKPLLKGAGENNPDHANPLKMLIIIDQFEELFTDKNLPVESREAFLRTVEALAKSGFCWVVATMRSDFYPVAQKSATFVRMKGENGQFDLLPPDHESLRRIITEPARMAGVQFEKRPIESGGQSVVGRIMDDVKKQSDLLPLISDLMLELYKLRNSENTITFAAYESLGDENRTGLEGALSQRADKEFARLTAEQQAACPGVFQSLVSVEGESEVRRRASISALRDSEAKAEVVSAFVEARLLTADGSDVFLAHEALLRKWDRIADWVRDNRKYLQIRSRIERSMERWQRMDNDPSLLLSEGLNLEEGIALLDDGSHLLEGVDYADTRNFIIESRRFHARREKRLRSIRHLVTLALALLSVFATSGAVFGWLQADRAGEERDNARHAEGQSLFSKAIVLHKDGRHFPDVLFHAARAVGFAGLGKEDFRTGQEGPEFGLQQFFPAEADMNRLALFPPLLDPDKDAVSTEVKEFIASRPHYLPVWNSGNRNAPALSVDMSPDGRFIFACFADGSLLKWDLKGSKEVFLPEKNPDLKVVKLRFCPFGRRVAAVGRDHVIYFIDPESGETVHTVEAHSDTITDIVFSPDGNLLASGSKDGTVKILDVAEGKLKATLQFERLKSQTVVCLAISSFGYLGGGLDDGTIFLWPIFRSKEEPRFLTERGSSVTALAFRPGDSFLLSGSGDHSIQLWDTATKQLIGSRSGHKGAVNRICFSPDGQSFVSASGDGTMQLWDVEDFIDPQKSVKATLHGHVPDTGVNDVSFPLDGDMLLSAGEDGSIKMWSVGDVNSPDVNLFAYLDSGWFAFHEVTQELEACRVSGGGGEFLNLSENDLPAIWRRSNLDAEQLLLSAANGQNWPLTLSLIDREPELLEAFENLLADQKTNLFRPVGDLWSYSMLERKIRQRDSAPWVTAPRKPSFVNGAGMELVWVSPGKFQMGSPENEVTRLGGEVQHEVTLTSGFWIAKHETTQAQWEEVMGYNPGYFKGSGGFAPVENVNWFEAIEFCDRLNKLESKRLPEGWEYSLPSEAQWEYACRTGAQTMYGFGDVITDRHANFDGNFPPPGGTRTLRVGSFEPNQWGIFDMHGNVREWCFDGYGKYQAEAAIDPLGKPSGDLRIHRGGGWNNIATDCRSAIRIYSDPGVRLKNLGFRAVLIPSTPVRIRPAQTYSRANFNEPKWVIACEAEQERVKAEACTQKYRDQGLPSSILWLPDYSSVSNARFWLTFVGPFAYAKKEQARTVLRDKVIPIYGEAYGIKIDNSGKRETFYNDSPDQK